jgi:hypothetical protein
MDRLVFGELLSAGYGLLTGRLPGSGGCLDHEVFMAISDGSCRNDRRKICMRPMILCTAVLATSLLIGGVDCI